MSENSNRSAEEQIYDNFVEILKEETKPNDEGKVPKLGAAMANVIRQFLNDQNIQADHEKHKPLGQLAAQAGYGRNTPPFAERPSDADLKPSS